VELGSNGSIVFSIITKYFFYVYMITHELVHLA